MSWPARACPSAIRVKRSLSPLEVIRSPVISTFSFAAHSLQSLTSTSLSLGTQWSQTPKASFPAA